MHDNHVLCVQLHQNIGDIWQCHELATTTAQPVASLVVRMCPIVVRKNCQPLDADPSAMSEGASELSGRVTRQCLCVLGDEEKQRSARGRFMQ